MEDSSKLIENKAKYNKKLKRYINYPQILELILKIDPLLKEAYELKESYLFFNQNSTLETARQNLAELIAAFSNSHLHSFQNLSGTLLDWYEEIINSFIIFEGKRISNGRIEATNARIKVILKNANGFRNFSRMRNKIMYALNKNSVPSALDKKQKIKKDGKKRGHYHKNKH